MQITNHKEAIEESEKIVQRFLEPLTELGLMQLAKDMTTAWAKVNTPGATFVAACIAIQISKEAIKKGSV